MAKNWTDYLEADYFETKSSQQPAVYDKVPVKGPFYDIRTWNVNDWASFVSIAGTALFWGLERNNRNKQSKT